ncbi:MAG: hypothetical protein ACQERB_05690 [Promethearchaeati archaeon]
MINIKINQKNVILITSETWIEGFSELLRHASDHFKKGEDFDLRIALISIDNAIEIALKTYLMINRRSLGINRKEFKNAKRSFPVLLDVLLRYSPKNIPESDLDAIEFYHNLRNSLYHEPIGIIPKKEVVPIYLELAKNIIKELFGIKDEKILGEIEMNEKEEQIKLFLDIWNEIRTNLRNFTLTESLIPKINKPYTILKIIPLLEENKKISSEFAEKILKFYQIRNYLVHGKRDVNSDQLNEWIEELREIGTELISFMNK